MKVALYNLTTTWQFGGVESFVWELGRCLQARRIEVAIVSGKGGFHRTVPGVRVCEFEFLSRNRLRSFPGLKKAYTLTKLLERLTFGAAALSFMRREHFDLVHIQKPYDLPAAVLLKGLVGSRIIFGCHGTDFFPGDRFLASKCDASVSCSAFNAEQVRLHYGFTPRVVFNGVDPVIFCPQEVDSNLRNELASDGALILYAGRLVEWKGVQYLIDAVARLSQKHKVSLAIAGAGDYRGELHAQALQANISERVKFIGFVPPEKLPRLYAASDVVALGSYANETFSISLLEAMACARPTVGTNFGGIPEVVSDGETGLLARPRDSADLASKLSRLLEDKSLREQMGTAGRRRALELFTWGQVTDRVTEVYVACVSS